METRNDISPLLDKLKKSSPYSVPDKYFENLSGRVLDRVRNEKPQRKNLTLLQTIKPYLSLAAGLAFVLVTGYSVMHFYSSHSKVLASNKSNEYLERELSSIDENTIVDFIAKDDAPIETVAVDDKSTTAIIDYLSESNLNVDDISTEL